MADEKVIDLDRLSRFHDNLKSNGLPLNNWQANKKYKIGYTVIQDGKFYRCKTEHTSTATFDNTKFDLVGGSGSGIQNWTSNTSYYTQVLAIGVTDASSSSPYLKNLVITPTNKFILPPIDVLQESAPESATITVSSFNSEDASKFNYDNDYVEFDGNMHLNTEYDVPMSTPTVITDGTNTGYISESDNIDFGDWDNVEGVDVV